MGPLGSSHALGRGTPGAPGARGELLGQLLLQEVEPALQLRDLEQGC